MVQQERRECATTPLVCSTLLVTDFSHVESRVAQISEVEHRGDFIVHETMDLLSRTFITPLEGDEIRALVSALDDVVDSIEAAADALLLYKVEQPIPEAIELAAPAAGNAPSCSRGRCRCWPTRRTTVRKSSKCAVEINRLENEADRVLRQRAGSPGRRARRVVRAVPLEGDPRR